MKKLFFLLTLMIGMATFSGCGPTRYTVTTQPAVPYYARPASPGVGYVWVDGEWTWRGGRYVYVNGYWARPRRGYHGWVSGHWARRGNGWYWVPGHWSR